MYVYFYFYRRSGAGAHVHGDSVCLRSRTSRQRGFWGSRARACSRLRIPGTEYQNHKSESESLDLTLQLQLQPSPFYVCVSVGDDAQA
jgi:hypothetical protein